MTATLQASRRAGVLLHPSSLPGEGFCGSVGSHARRFVDLLGAAGLQVWQVLPLGPTHADGCPYQSMSVHAGNTDLIDLQWLAELGLLSQAEAQCAPGASEEKTRLLDKAAETFYAKLAGDPLAALAARYHAFVQQAAHWLEDYVRFRAFREHLWCTPWTSWPEALRRREAGACDALAVQLAERLNALRFGQFVFHCQWDALRTYANQRGILLFGDMPIYVHLESADVWAHQSLFKLDAGGHPVTVTGVPPDYFSSEGQLWGNPQYDWGAMQRAGFDWWLRRFATAAQQFDITRIDHFRALDAYWEIPAGATSAREGAWVAAPGRALLEKVRENFPGLSLVAENLGIISEEVEALRNEFELPGMLILQFAFDGNPDNPYLMHRHTPRDVVYTGTHDNNTTLGWFESLDAQTRGRVYQYFDNPPESMPWMLIRQAMWSVANTAIVPWQDFLGLNGEHRMNTPGSREGNWRWRFAWEQVPGDFAQRIHALLQETGRLPDS
ncbi:MAG: 4-alpha-glucanotransferase [Halioglobus sp.]